MLFDTGADRCFVDSNLLARIGMRNNPRSVRVDLADGSAASVVGVVPKAHFAVGGFRCKHDFLELPLTGRPFDVVVGEDFLTRHGCVIDYSAQRITARKGKRMFVLF